MRRPFLIWQLLPAYLAVLFAALGGLTYFTSATFAEIFRDNMAVGLESRAQLLLPQFEAAVLAGDYSAVDALCKGMGAASGSRITVVAPDGQVWGDSAIRPELMENHASRPEIQEAVSGRSGTSLRLSNTLNQKMMYHAAPLLVDGEPRAYVRVAAPISVLEEAQAQFYRRMLLLALGTAVLSTALSWLIIRRILRPVTEMKESARFIAEGAFSHRLPLPQTREFAELGEAVNRMAQELDERIRTMTRRVNEEEAILSSMVESVIAVDLDEHIISINRAAAELLGVDQEKAKGQNIYGVIRNVGLQEFIANTLESGMPIESELQLHTPNDLVLQAHGTLLHDGEEKTIGALIVMNDITRLRRLEQIRRDFVANVSHELRTPITSIKGFVESLQDGALESREDTDRFLGIIATQSNRLNAIIEDLLTLSRIEQNEESPEGLLQVAGLGSVVHGAVQLCSSSAQQKDIKLEVRIEDGEQIEMNVQLMQQALVNLIDNAIKYSEPGQKVSITSERLNGSIRIRVGDSGMGIPSEHLPRLFERFYRVDRARSRALGGTGLGLAIVKHIVQIHKGRVEVESTYGEGSTFSILLPLKSGDKPQ